MHIFQIINQAFTNKRIASVVRKRQRRAVLFVFLLFVPFPLLFSCLSFYRTAYALGGMTDRMEDVFPENGKYTVKVRTSRGELRLGMERYIAYALPAVIPADYEEEMLKVQAILLRTELLYLYEEQKKQQGELPGWEPYCIELPQDERFKNYMTFSEQKKFFGENYEESITKYCHAVLETSGMYVKKNEKPAKTAWFRVSAGITREGILCEQDYKSQDYFNSSVITWKEFKKTMQTLLGPEVKNVQEIHFLKEEEASVYPEFLVFEVTLQTDGGGNEVSRRQIPAAAFCQAFRLLSPCIQDIEENRSEVRITVKGAGHGSGMSQYAANELAKEEKDYTEILNTFFTNIAIDKFE